MTADEPCTVHGIRRCTICLPAALGRAAYRRGEGPFAIQDRALDPAIAAVALPDTAGARDAIYRAWGDGWSAAREAGEPRTDPPLPAPKPALTITHTPADGTLLEGTVKGDGAWEAIKAAQAKYTIRGWRYMPSIRAIGVSHSRDRAPNLGLIDRTAEILREAGFTVEVQVDAAPRAMEEAEADRAERMDDRADALAAKAERKNAEADRRQAAASQIAQRFADGQPILVGHHSERSARRDQARIETNMRAAIQLGKEAEHAAHGAGTAEKHMQHREDPRRTMRRIEKLEADRRRVQRTLDGHTTRSLDGHGNPVYVFEHKPAEGRHREQCEVEAAHLDEQIRYWKELLQAEIDAGRFNPVDLAAIKPGDRIRYWGGWREVVRVNKKTVSVKTQYSWTDKVPVDEVLEHRPAQPAPTSPAQDLDEAEATAR